MIEPLVFGIGEIVWDCLPEGRKLGGAPVNFAYYAGLLGARSYPISAVGSDSLGSETLAYCRRVGLDTRYVAVNGLPTSRVLVTLDDSGIPKYDILQDVSWDRLEARPEAMEALSRADAVCWGTLAGRSEASWQAIAAMVAATPASCMKVFDINLRQHYYSRERIELSLTEATALKLNEDELPVLVNLFLLSQDASHALVEIARRWDIQYVIYTCGAAYSEIYSKDGMLSHIETPKVPVIDTVGAGDSFTAAFVTSLLQEKPVEDAHADAVALAARVCMNPGAIIDDSGCLLCLKDFN